MPRKPKKERVVAPYYVWLLGERNGVYTADGRGNQPDLGRHSLGTRDPDEARRKLQQLDLVKAVEFGRADAALLTQGKDRLLPLAEGYRLYMEHNSRPVIQGGVTASTMDRYRSVFKKFLAYAERNQIRYWQQVTKAVVDRYGTWLNQEDYPGGTQRYEMMLVKQAINWMVSEGLLPSSSNFHLALKKIQGTSTYCYSLTQVLAMIAHCKQNTGLMWLADVILALAVTGLRIGELTGLRWSNLDLERGLLLLTDTTRSSRRSERSAERKTKSHRSRTFPIHQELLPVLKRLYQSRVDGHVFSDPKTGGALSPQTVRTVLMRDVLAPLGATFPASGDDPGILAGRLHSFRHFFCSWSADNRTPEQMLMAWLGHRESEMIRHYYHLRQDEARRQMDRMPFAAPPLS
jgi:integrase